MVEKQEKEVLIAPFLLEIKNITCHQEEGLTRCNVCCSESGDILFDLVQEGEKWYIQMEFLF